MTKHEREMVEDLQIALYDALHAAERLRDETDSLGPQSAGHDIACLLPSLIEMTKSKNWPVKLKAPA